MRFVGYLVLAACLPGCDTAPRFRGTSALGDTEDRSGPYRVLTEMADPDGVDRVWLHYLPGEAGEAVTQMKEVRPAIFEGLIPGQPPFTLVLYYVEAVDRGTHVVDPPDAQSAGAALFGFWVLGSACASTVECGPGEACDASGVCRGRQGSCVVHADCGKGFRCGPAGTCLLGVRLCSLDEGCLSGEVCDRNLGQCVPRPSCGERDVCPVDFVCHAVTGTCKRACLGTGECGPGETCQAGICSGAHPCATDPSCASGLVCDPYLKLCRPPGAGLCAPCTLDQDCGGPTDFCLVVGQAQVCGRDCSKLSCPAGYTCSQSLIPPQCVPATGVCGA